MVIMIFSGSVQECINTFHSKFGKLLAEKLHLELKCSITPTFPLAQWLSHPLLNVRSLVRSQVGWGSLFFLFLFSSGVFGDPI